MVNKYFLCMFVCTSLMYGGTDLIEKRDEKSQKSLEHVAQCIGEGPSDPSDNILINPIIFSNGLLEDNDHSKFESEFLSLDNELCSEFWGLFSLPLVYDLTGQINRFFSSDDRDKNVASEYSIFQAIAENNLDKVKELYQKDKNVIHEIWHSQNPLQLAFEIESWEIAQYLIEQGANVHEKLIDGSSLFQKATRAQQMKLIDLLHAKGTTYPAISEADDHEKISNAIDSLNPQDLDALETFLLNK